MGLQPRLIRFVFDGANVVNSRGFRGNIQVECWAPLGRMHAFGTAFVEEYKVDASVVLHRTEHDAVKWL
ncbi:hypothetical protein D3C84_1125520 [compost metagenome]